jgi:RNA polymerase sigma-70 factor (ECF subfamily)
LTERELIEGCQKKDAKCQYRLFELFSGKMMTVCRRYARDQKEAEDILQESFIRIFDYIGQYRFEGSFEGWVRRIVVNAALNLLQRRRVKFVDTGPGMESIAAAATVDAEVITKLSTEELLKLIGHLPDGYRLVFNLYVIEGYDHNEIARMLNISAVTSRTQLLKARHLLRTQIENLQKMPEKYA